MEVNLLLLIVLFFMVFKMSDGYKKGMVKEIVSFVTLVILSLTVVLIANGLKSYMKHEFLKLIIAVILLTILGVVHHMLKILFFSAKVISKLPVISRLDKILGIAVGCLECILVLWTIYALIRYIGLGWIGRLLEEETKKSRILLFVYDRNLLITLVDRMMSLIFRVPVS